MRAALLGLLAVLPFVCAAGTRPSAPPSPDLATLEYLADWPDAERPETPAPDDPVLTALDALKALAPPTGEPHDPSKPQR